MHMHTHARARAHTQTHTHTHTHRATASDIIRRSHSDPLPDQRLSPGSSCPAPPSPVPEALSAGTWLVTFDRCLCNSLEALSNPIPVASCAESTLKLKKATPPSV